MLASLKTRKQPSGANVLRLVLIGLNLALLGTIGGVLNGLFRPGAVDDPIPAVDPLQLALASDPPAPEFGDLAALVRAQLDVPLPEPEPAPAAEPSVGQPSPLAGWGVVALLQRPGLPTTAILGSGGRQVTVQEGDPFLDGQVRAIHLDPENGSVRVQVSQGDRLADLEHRFDVH